MPWANERLAGFSERGRRAVEEGERAPAEAVAEGGGRDPRRTPGRPLPARICSPARIVQHDAMRGHLYAEYDVTALYSRPRNLSSRRLVRSRAGRTGGAGDSLPSARRPAGALRLPGRFVAPQDRQFCGAHRSLPRGRVWLPSPCLPFPLWPPARGPLPRRSLQPLPGRPTLLTLPSAGNPTIAPAIRPLRRPWTAVTEAIIAQVVEVVNTCFKMLRELCPELRYE